MKYFNMYFFNVVKTKYFTLRGRADQKEYWLFILFYYILFFVVTMGLGMLAMVVGLTLGDLSEEAAPIVVIPVFLIFLVLCFGLLPPLFAVFVRRLHDTGRSAWWCLLAIVPFGSIVLLVFTILDSQPGPNQYGPNPKGVEALAASDIFV